MEVHVREELKRSSAKPGEFQLANKRTLVFPHGILILVESEASEVKTESCSKKTIFRHKTHAHTHRAFLVKYLCGLGYPTNIKELPVKEKNNKKPQTKALLNYQFFFS